jgi:type VI secretion system protein ImpJ
MKNLPVHWSEGMFLRPHHFQAADRFWTESLAVSQRWDCHYNYGVRQIDISPEAVANYQVEVRSCQARMPDGTLIVIEPNQGLDRVDLRKALSSQQRVRVYLAVPRIKLGGRNVAQPGVDGKPRYFEVLHALQDESQGGNDQELGLRDLNVRVMLEGEETEGYELLPIAQVQRAGETDPVPQLDGDYFPPMLAIDAWAPLGAELVRSIYDSIGKRIERRAEQIVSRGVSFGPGDPIDMTRLFMLHEMNEAYAALGVLAFASGVHPIAAYAELCRIVGQLSIFDQATRRVPLDIPRYDHDDLARIFRYVKQKIDLLLDAVPEDRYEQRFFEGFGKGMRCRLDPKWLGSDWEWYVGVSYSGDISEAEVRSMLSPGYLDWKLGSERQVDDLFEFGLEGLHLIPQDRTPRPLPERRWIYYQVTRGNAAFRDVMDHESLAMRLKEGLILNYATLKGERKLRIRFENKQTELQFALFAVQK